MDEELSEWIERRFAVPSVRASKVTTLSDAVATHVRPGDRVHLGLTHARGSAAHWELLRQHIGTEPGFELCAVQMTTPQTPFVHAGLARKVVTSWAGDSYWGPAPSPVYQRAWKAGLEFEQWSILTFAQRLAAGARGVALTTTRALANSSMETDLGLQRAPDGSVLIPALVPDVSLVHAPAADENGNVLFSPPLFESLNGALAAMRGAVVTVDRVVDASFVREHAHMARLPASAVAAVVEAPLGAHPGGLLPTGIDGVQPYGEDWEFWVELRKAGKDPATLDEWIKEWIVGPGSHEGYVAKLGQARVAALRERSEPDAWRAQLETFGDFDAPPNAIETAIVAAARVLAERIEVGGLNTMLAGAGMANLAAWLAAYDLAERGTHVDLVAEMGLVGYWPRPGEPILFNQRNFPTCTMLTEIDIALGVLVGGARARSIGALGAAQVDRHGNINSTCVPGSHLLMGSGGANDVITCATESVVLATQSKERFLERVPYVTGPGDRVSALVSTLGIYRRDADGEFVLTEVFGSEVAAAVRECRERCGWDLRVAPGVAAASAPTRAEVRMLRLMDPKGWFRA
jgi:acyl CoA:acetate/3-ketoacid CoA transferase alpha subunit/acyl CoA:acetate/3-ketoacid CoA transferase beta subunit